MKLLAIGQNIVHVTYVGANFAGIRVLSPSQTDEHVYVPGADIYLRCQVDDLLALSNLFSQLARQLQGIEA